MVVPYHQGAIDLVRPRASFGIWTLMNTGADPFGDPVRSAIEPEGAIKLLAGCGVPYVSLHDLDVGLDPWVVPDPAVREKRLTALRQFLKANGVKVWMYTPCLFKHPLVRAGSVTSNDPRVRHASVQKMLLAADVAEAFGAQWLTFWLGRDGAEVDALIDPVAAYTRIADALHRVGKHILDRQYKVMISLEPKPNEPRGDIYLSTIGAALGIINLVECEACRDLIAVNPELLQHEGMAGLNACHAIGQLVAADKLAFLHLGGQTPLRYDQDHPFCGGNSCLKSSFYLMLAIVTHAPNCVLEFDCHPFRTEAGETAREEFVMANLEAAGLLTKKAETFLAHPAVQEILKESDGRGFGGPAGAKVDVSRIAADLNPRAQELDRLVNLHLLGELD